MTTTTSGRGRPAAASQLVRYGTPEYRTLLADIAAGAEERERTEERPHAAIDAIRRAGLGALRVSPSGNAPSITVTELFAAVIDLAEADSNVAHILRTHYYFVETRLHGGRGGEPDPWLDRLRAGAIFGNATMELGGPLTRMATRLVPTADGLELSGTKFYTTGSLYADWVNVAATDPEDRMVIVSVPTDRPGVTIEDDWDGIGQRMSGSGTTRLDRVQVAPEEVLKHIGGADAAADFPPGFLQLFLTAAIAGVLRTARSHVVEVLRARPRSLPHAPTQVPREDVILQQALGQVDSITHAAETLVLAAARTLDALWVAVDEGSPEQADIADQVRADTARAKVVVDRLALEAATALFDIGSASSTRRGLNLDRHWRNIRTMASHNPASYKAQALGNRLVNGVALPANALF
ncbi:acyl-CoA dehydrogenase family protein [Pseudonocardia halophobica]|uniref:Dibenzothiophene monooxygenase n=1 Tax=Pseudonocardia halophobica TaxID=29401 RepID=A0A9W6L087_9PSEU|nr:acyl-CoA dehydrogenase family protein [Pseudonocardia halophobica]GLL10552.1 putative acyl-CoA dehydrogenase [Pseudonocardia halophobica]